ncbi:GTPase IMAP family member 8 isoform X3 [Alosa pseudoharengus]
MSDDLTQLRIVLLGSRRVGKSSTGNTILCGKVFDSSQRTGLSVQRHGKVGLSGREVTVVDTPGWWSNVPLSESAQITKDEIVRSVSMCPQGPHAFIVIIRPDSSFTEEDRVALQEHIESLGPNVWDHTIVLFTCGEWLGHTPIEEHIECEGHALQWVIDKCGNRYHVFDNMDKIDMQVTRLFKKLESMVAKNGGCHFEMDQRKCQEIGDKWRMVKEKAEDRQMRSYKDRATFQWVMGKCMFLSELRIVLLGCRKAGKSSVGNAIFKETSGDAEVFDASERTSQCVKKTDITALRQVTVVDTPGWTKERDTDLSTRQIRRCVSLLPCAPHAVPLVIDLDSAFTEGHRTAAQEHLELLGKNIWCHTIVLFTYGDCLGGKSIEQHIESEGGPLQWIIRMCGNRYHVFDNTQEDEGQQVRQLLDMIEEMAVMDVLDRNNMNWKVEEELEKSILTPPDMDRSVQVLSSYASAQTPPLMGQSSHIDSLVDLTGPDISPPLGLGSGAESKADPSPLVSVQSSNRIQQWWKNQRPNRRLTARTPPKILYDSDSGSRADSNNSSRSNRSIGSSWG